MGTSSKKEVIIYTDGACKGNPGPGGWAAVLMYGDVQREISGGERHTTNNRTELMAAIQALEALKEPVHVRLHTDSAYLVSRTRRMRSSAKNMSSTVGTTAATSWPSPRRRNTRNETGPA